MSIPVRFRWATLVARSISAFLVALAIVVSSFTPSQAQVGGEFGTVTGTVQNNQGQPIANARVTLASPSQTFRQTTDARGNFTFLGVTIDTYTISVQATGLAPLTQPGITVTGSNTTALGNVRLQSQLRQIGSVSARSPNSAFQPNETIPQFTISGGVLEATQGKAANSNQQSVLLAVPGFQLDRTNNLVLNGSTTDQIHYQFDGVDFTDPGFTGSANEQFFNGISNVQVVPGAGDPSQGNSGAGVVNLVVKRGTYPGTGLFDVEQSLSQFGNQVNFQYGAATKSGNVSDFVSFFGNRFRYQYGAQNSNAFNDGNNVAYANDFQETADFINNAVVRFGPNLNQSFQFLYLSHAAEVYGPTSGLRFPFDDDSPASLANVSQITGIASIPVIQSIFPFEQGQTSLAQLAPTQTGNQNSELIKFEYDNQFNSTTYLNLRFFHSDVFAFELPSGAEFGTPTPGQAEPLYAQTSGGSRTGANFELSKQADPHNLLTLSGSYELNRPNFGVTEPLQGVEVLGPNAIDFAKPPNPNLPVSATNPCPIAGGCYLQQFFYTTGGTPTVPPLDLQSTEIQKEYGVGLRDQITINPRLRLDLGVRYDLINNGYGNDLSYEDVDTQPVPGSPGTFFINNYGFVEQPHFIEPRAAINFRVTNNDSVSFSYGRSINLSGSGELASPEAFEAVSQFANIPANPNYIAATGFGNPAPGPASCYPTIPFPTGATVTTAPSYKGVVGTTLQLGKPCASYAQQLYFQQDAYFPEITAVQPAVFDNFNLDYSHGFANGSAIKISPFIRQGYKIPTITAPLVFNPVTGTYSFGSLSNQSAGIDQTTGVGVQYTLPDRKIGFNGFVSLAYVNEFSNTPPAGDNPYAQDFEPILLPVFAATDNTYRAGFISPFTTRVGLSYKTKSGFRINPVVNFNVGFPYNAGLLTPYIPSSGAALNIPNTNVTDPFGPGGAPQYVDPANPGSVYHPNIAATRGTNETPSGGGLLSRPQITTDLTFEYTPPSMPRVTIGAQIIDLFNNGFFNVPTPNPNYYPVTSGVAGPTTGQNTPAVFFPGQTPFVATNTMPYSAFNVSPFYGETALGTPSTLTSAIPTTIRLYLQYAL